MSVTITDPATITDYRELSVRLAMELRYCMELLTEHEWGDLEDRCWYRDGTEALELFNATEAGQ